MHSSRARWEILLIDRFAGFETRCRMGAFAQQHNHVGRKEVRYDLLIAGSCVGRAILKGLGCTTRQPISSEFVGAGGELRG